MGREQMRNLDVAKVGVGNTVNEFEYQKHQGEITEQEHPGQGGGGKRLTQAERVAEIFEVVASCSMRAVGFCTSM